MERIKVIEGMIAENGEKLDRLIDLYLSGAVAKELLADRQQRLENNIAVLTKEREELVAQMKHRTLTSEEIQSIRELAERTAKGLSAIDGCDDLESRKCIIDALDVTALVEVDGETRIANLKCILAETRLPITDKQIHEIVLFVG